MRRLGVQAGNWLTPEQGRRLLVRTQPTTPREARDQLPPDGSIDVLGRLLAYMYRHGESGNFRQSLSGELLREGYSKAFLTDYRAAQGFPNISALYKTTLVDLEKDGRESRRGFWNRYGARLVMKSR